jgi:DNA-binding transcriptional LysR family regulator
MTVRHLKIFVKVYQLQSITHAAQELQMAQPAVTRAVKELEQYYGVLLFDRVGRGLAITESGRELYAYALHVVELFDTMEKSMRNWDSFGVLRIGSSVTIGTFLLPALVDEFKALRPGIRLQVLVSNGRNLQKALLDNELDFALIEEDIGETEFHTEPFAQDHLVLITPQGHPLLGRKQVLLQDLVAYDLLLREQGSASRSFVDSVFAVHELPTHPLWESVSTQALVRAVHAGIGISLLPERMVREDVRTGFVAACPLADEGLERRYDLVWHKNKYLTVAARDFIGLCHARGAKFC